MTELVSDSLQSVCDDISLIATHLYLGSFKGATSRQLLTHFNIRRVLTVISAREAIPAELQVPWVEYKFCVKFDIPGQDMLLSMIECTDFIAKSVRLKENILVHCMMGVSRSATMVIAYLMRANKWSFEKALAHAQSCRPVSPNFGFRYQLRLFGAMRYRLDVNNKEFRLYFFNIVAFHDYSKGFHKSLAVYLEKLRELEQATKVVYNGSFCCAVCSKPLFTDLNVFQTPKHQSSGSANVPNWSPMPGQTSSVQCKYYLIEPVAWMVDKKVFSRFPANSTGKIPCRECGTLVGKYIFYPFQSNLCPCPVHRGILSCLAINIHREGVFYKERRSKDKGCILT